MASDAYWPSLWMPTCQWGVWESEIQCGLSSVHMPWHSQVCILLSRTSTMHNTTQPTHSEYENSQARHIPGHEYRWLTSSRKWDSGYHYKHFCIPCTGHVHRTYMYITITRLSIGKSTKCSQNPLWAGTCPPFVWQMPTFAPSYSCDCCMIWNSALDLCALIKWNLCKQCWRECVKISGLAVVITSIC
jgi:hypothetical protein